MSHVIAGDSGDSRGVALLIDVVSAFLVVVGVDGLLAFSAFRTIWVGSTIARLFFECRFS